MSYDRVSRTKKVNSDVYWHSNCCFLFIPTLPVYFWLYPKCPMLICKRVLYERGFWTIQKILLTYLCSPAKWTPGSQFHTGLKLFQSATYPDGHVLLQSRLTWTVQKMDGFFHMAGHVLSLCVVMLADKQANKKLKKSQSQGCLKRRTCSANQSNDSREGS